MPRAGWAGYSCFRCSSSTRDVHDRQIYILEQNYFALLAPGFGPTSTTPATMPCSSASLTRPCSTPWVSCAPRDVRESRGLR